MERFMFLLVEYSERSIFLPIKSSELVTFMLVKFDLSSEGVMFLSIECK